jgi:thioesterase domain-containing protein
MFNEFLKELHQKSVKITFSDGKLTFEGPENNITPELIAKLKEYKGSLIKYYWPPECVNMMPINPLGSKVPFTLIYFEVMNYPLSDYFGKDQPFYGFLHYGSKGEKIKYDSVEAFAADYVIQLQKVMPKGPYFLGGFSFGGILAFEMSIQLQKAGYEVPFLALLDSKTSVTFVPIALYDNIFKIIKSNILGPFKRRMLYLLRLFVCKVFLFIDKPVPVFLRNFYIGHKYRKLTEKYQPGKFDGEILLFRSVEANPAFKYNGWEAHANKVNLVHFKGGHHSIARKKEYAEMIGKEFLDHLDRISQPSVKNT